MNKYLLIFILLLFFQPSFSNGVDNTSTMPKVKYCLVDDYLQTKLIIFVFDMLGNRQEGVSVALYDSEENYRNEKNPISQVLLTDKKGRVAFKKLQPKIYFIHAKKGDLNNNNNGVKTETLDKGKANKINIIID